MHSEYPIIIIGSGLAGYNVAREFRKLNTTAELILIANDAADFYSKPMLSNALAKNKTAKDLPIANADKMAKDLNAKILKHTRVNKIDPDNHALYTSNNEMLNYSKLVLALGASSITLPISGNAADKIFTVNDLESYAAFREAIAGKKKITIIGAGLIGCEFANDLVLSGYDVSVIGLENNPLDRLLPEQAAEYLKAALAEQGVNWYLGQETKEINVVDSVFNIKLESRTELENNTSSAKGITLEADVVLSAIGLRPNIQLAKEAGIEVNKAIVVKQNLETNYKDIYALGDCAEVAGLFLPYVMPLMNSARALAKTLNGEISNVTYPAMPVLVKTPSCSVVVAAPANNIEGEWAIKTDGAGVHAQYFDQNGKLQGFALVGKAVEDKQALTKELPAVLV
ncbi:MAG: FAD-dependent oxidoreductase [Gammaproteobacteria bacterium]|nr:FAD-dependent oxidoreductase [Gammaproteobacteria bacterium]MCW8988838.1 FAD-dependent oxidoreductase [Gammaproteobacteria bacterium]MCW9031717.1 FAD-dependent oxidoreductase [Gammaproteobacteria bacterium]